MNKGTICRELVSIHSRASSNGTDHEWIIICFAEETEIAISRVEPRVLKSLMVRQSLISLRNSIEDALREVEDAKD